MNKRYQIIKKLGAGGMGEVFLAYDRLNIKNVALKKILFHTHGDAHKDSLSRRESFAHEFALLASLRHPYIISVLDYGFDESGSPFFTMELVDNPLSLLESVDHVILGKKIDVLLEILQALNYLHHRKVTHRDLKPGNILIGENGAKLLDFGLAQEAQTQLKKSDEISGTLAYMAPEILSGNGFSSASDLYALGLIAYEILLGRHPYKGDNFADIIQKVLYLPLDVTSIENPLVAQTVERLLEKNPLKRLNALETIEAFCQAIDRHLPAETQLIRDSYLTTARFVGREKEIKTVLDSLSSLKTNGGQFYLVAGENGVGKTRFLNELAILGLVRKTLVLRGRATNEGASSLHLFRPVLRYLALNVDVTIPEAMILQDVVPDIQTLLNLAPLDDAAHLPPPQAKQRLINCIVGLFKRLQQKTILILEDIHWANESYELLNRLVDELKDLPLIILASYRIEEQPALEKAFSQAQNILISKFTKAEVQVLSDAILGSAATNSDIPNLLEFQSGGNAFFIIELIRTLADTAGSLESIGKMTLPLEFFDGGIQTMIDKHLSHLDSASRQVMVWAAIAGQELDLDLLYHAFGRETVDIFLLNGEDTRIIQVQQESWQFSQDRLRRALLKKLDNAELSQLHREVALAIEATKPNLNILAAKLAHHWQQAEDPLKERTYTKIAAEQALKIGIYVQAIPALERALTLYTAELSEEAATIKEHLDVHLLYCSALLATKGQAAIEVITAYDVARSLAEKLGPTPETGNIYFGMAVFYFTRGRLQTARSLLHQTLQLADHYADDEMRMQASMSMSNVLFWMGELPQSLDFSANVIRYYDASNTQEFNVRYAQNPRITTMNSRVWANWLMGHPALAHSLAKETLTLAEALAHPFNKAISLQILAFLHLYQHDAQACYESAQALLSFAQTHGFMVYKILGDIFSTWALAKIDPDTGIGNFKTALGHWEGMGAKLGNSIFFALLAELYLEHKDFTALGTTLDAAFLHAEQTSEKVYLAELYRVRGLAYFEQGKSHEAHIALDQARKIAHDQGAVILELRALINLATHAPSASVVSRMAELLGQFDEQDKQELVIRTAQTFLP